MKRFFLTTLLFSAILIKAESIVIDGILDEPEWANAFSISEFYQTSPFNLQKSEGETLVYIFSNEDGIYVGCLLYTSPSPRDAHESRMPSSA